MNEFPFSFRLAEDELQVRLGPWTIRAVRYRDIEDVVEAYTFWNEHWTNPWPWRFLTVKTPRAMFHNLVLNPSDREAFARELRVRVSAAKGGGR